MSRNRLAGETSPYLLQHKDNPVHWWPWGAEAFARAQKEDKPVLLSVGYAACHWCHVMAHESFEDEEAAAVMNELFVNVKVDREERPDVDTIYMNALHSMGERGGWPLTMFLTPEGAPFWGGTYFPKHPKYGRPGFIQIMQEIARIYREEPDKVRDNAEALKAAVSPRPGAAAKGEISEALLEEACRQLTGLLDDQHGGLQGTMKFPQSPFFSFLWRAGLRYDCDAAIQGTLKTLTHLCQGGIYDHLGGGFARYTVDAIWLAPHFEKMLYDNAQILDLLTEGWRETRNELFRVRVEETVEWLFREMTVAEGGFASSLDADSEGEEGKFYVWSLDEVEQVLGDDAPEFADVYDVRPGGNWEGKTILNRLGSPDLLDEKSEARLAQLRSKLLDARSQRIRPGFDDKVLADWNGLMIAALAKAGFVFEQQAWIEGAHRALAFVRSEMTRDGRLLHSWRDGQAKAPATASDYANMILGALSLHAVVSEPDLLDAAVGWVSVLDDYYWSDELGGYALTASDTTDVIVRPFSGQDDATPNPNGIMGSNLMALWLLTGEDRYRERAEELVARFTGAIAGNLFAHTSLLSAAMDVISPMHIVMTLSGGRREHKPMEEALRGLSLPRAVIQTVSDPQQLAATSPAFGKTLQAGETAAYVCVGSVCAPPVTSGKALAQTLRDWRRMER